MSSSPGGKTELRAIKTVAVEQWLKTLVTSKFGKPQPLAGGTREKIRDAMSSIFNHAIRREFTDRNQISTRNGTSRKFNTSHEMSAVALVPVPGHISVAVLTALWFPRKRAHYSHTVEIVRTDSSVSYTRGG